MLNIGEAIPWYLCMFLSFSCEWRSSVVQARMCKLGRDPLIFLKILVVIGHVCIYWSKVAEGFSVFNAVLWSLLVFLDSEILPVFSQNICNSSANVFHMALTFQKKLQSGFHNKNAKNFLVIGRSSVMISHRISNNCFHEYLLPL